MDFRRWDAFAIGAFLLALLASAARLSATGWTEGLELAALMALSGALLGLALGMSRFPPRLVAVLAGGYTVVLFPWLLGINRYPGLAWTARLAAMAERWRTAWVTLAARQPLEDTFLFLTLVSLAYWGMGLWGGFSLTRRGHFVMAALPAGLALFLVHAFAYRQAGGSAYLFVYLLASLLLLARLHFLHRDADWQEARVQVPPEAAHDWNLAVLVAVLLMVGLAWLLPAPAQAIGFAQRAWQRLTWRWQNRETDFSRLVAGLKTENRAAPYAGDWLVLGQDAASDAAAVFTVHLPPVDQVPRYYWRARVYDFYEDGRWTTRAAIVRHFSPAEVPLSLPQARGTLTTYTFTLHMPSEWLFTPPRSSWVSLPVRVGLAQASDGEEEPLFFQTTLEAGQEYQVQALDLSPTEAQLRAAGQEYPDWVGERYVQLPPEFSPSLRALAVELTAEAPTPYDKAQAITDWLRASIRYNEHIPVPPPGRDVLEWFLLDARQGFCTYFATAEVLLLRAVGVPARLAVGYAEGEIPPGTVRTRLVRQSHAHAWPEVYFPGIGWVEFEPTASQSPLRRPVGSAEDAVLRRTQATPTLPPAVPTTGNAAEGHRPAAASPRGRQAGFWPAVAVAVGLVAVFGGYLFWRRRRRRPALAGLLRPYLLRLPLLWRRWWARRVGRPSISRACAELYHAARRLRIALSPAQTPLEVASCLRARLPEAAPEIDALLTVCLPAMYGPEAGDWRAARAAAVALRRKSRRAAWQKRLHRH